MYCEEEQKIQLPPPSGYRPHSFFCYPSAHYNDRAAMSSPATTSTVLRFGGAIKRSRDEEPAFSIPAAASLKKKPTPALLDAPGCPVRNPLAGENKLISHLPDDCIRHIFSFLPSPRDRCSCAAVSRKWLLLQAHLGPSDFRHLLATTALPSSQERNDDDCVTPTSRCSPSYKTSDARLAAMAVATCARGAPTELVIKATATASDTTTASSLLLVSDMGLNVVSKACLNLRSLFLWDCQQVGNDGLAAVARNCGALEKLHISNAPLVDDRGLIPILKNCRGLSNLSLESCPHISDSAISAVALFCSNLESITLDNCPLVCDAGLVPVVSTLPKLSMVKIANAQVGDAMLEAIGARDGGNPVRSVSLENVTGFTHAGFRRLGMATSLQSLTVRCCSGLSDACFDSVDGSDGGSGVIHRETTFAALRSVTLMSCGTFSDRGLKHLSEKSRQLERLRLEKCHGITTEGLMGAVENWSETLRSLSIVKCNSISTTTQQQRQRGHGGAVTAALPRCPLLQSLTIKRCPRAGDQFLSVMGRVLVQAKRIAVVGMASVTDGGLISFLESMESPSYLQNVDLSGLPRITDWSVAALLSASGGALRRLTLEGCEGLTDRSLRMIGQLCPGLVELDLSGCGRISDGGVAGLLASGERSAAGSEGEDILNDAPGRRSSRDIMNSRLEVLSLEGCRGITDESLSSLEEMVVRGSLWGLNLKHCGGLTRAGIDSVRQTLWWCDLIF